VPLHDINEHCIEMLTDSNTSWSCSARDHPTRQAPTPNWRRGFPRASAVALARATVMLAWHTLRARPKDAALLGVAPGVAQVIAGLSLSQIDA